MDQNIQPAAKSRNDIEMEMDPSAGMKDGYEAQNHDAVFGEITEEGPDYRSVRTPRLVTMFDKLTFSGRPHRHSWSHDEDPNRSRRFVNPSDFRRARFDPWCHLSSRRRTHHHLVRLDRRRLQASPSPCLRHR